MANQSEIRVAIDKLHKLIDEKACNYEYYKSYYDLCHALVTTDNGNKKQIVDDIKWLRKTASENVKLISDKEIQIRFIDLIKRCYFYISDVDFESYLYALEWNRPKNERFYFPRRKTLGILVKYMQMLADDELDELFISMPPRVGKTTMIMFFITWITGTRSECSNLYSAYSDSITKAFYEGCLEIMQDPVTYCWQEIFPNVKIVDTDAKEEKINTGRVKRYASLTCRSIGGTLNGACDCNGFLVSDDLIGGIEEALNPDRLRSTWYKVDNNLIPRSKEKSKMFWMGTRWSQSDPTGVRIELVENDTQYKNRRIKFINLPALDENEESNFDYDFGVGFSTEYYIQRRASYERADDIASWLAQYMGQPIERCGSLFDPSEMHFYNGVLPDDNKLVRIFMAVDPAYGGGDFTSAPICYEYTDGSIYVADVVYSDGEKNITQPLLVEAAIKHNVAAIQFETNRSTAAYKETVEDMLVKKGRKINITSCTAPNNKSKEARIFDKAPAIREFYFLEDGKRDKMYSKFMQNVFSFTFTGKNKHDDSVDSLAMAVSMIDGGSQVKFAIKKRDW